MDGGEVTMGGVVIPRVENFKRFGIDRGGERRY